MAYLGNTPTTQNFVSGTDYFNGTGSQTAFTLTRTVGSVNDVEAVINNVVQQPNSAYTISGNTITFTSAPSAGTSNIYVRYLSTTTQVITPSQNTVGLTQLTADMQNGIGQAFKNRIINGAMMIDQRNAGASVAITGADTFQIDRWSAAIQGSGTGRFSVQQSTVVPTGFRNSLAITVTTADAAPSASFAYHVNQPIEGFNTSDLGFGTASASTVTLSFWVRSSVTGTLPITIANATSTRVYGATYVVNAANTWEQKSITVAGDTSGTWLTNNELGLRVLFGLGGGSSRTISAGWQTVGGTYQTNVTGCTSIIGTNGATFYITGVQLEKGSTATSFDYRPYGTELQLCQRYYEKSYDISVVPNTVNAGNGLREMGTSSYSNNVVYNAIPFCVRKRTTPTVTPISILGVSGEWEYGRSGASSTAAVTTAVGVGETSFVVRCNVGAAWVVAYLNGHFTASAEL